MKTSGSTTDSLTLTKPGTSGPLNYEFVGGGFWQRTTDGASAVTGQFDAFSYGIETLDTALPRTGRAEYAVTILGAQTFYNNTIVPLSGQGTSFVDFASGAVVTHGSLNGTAGSGSGGEYIFE